MSTNPTIELARVTSDIDLVQFAIGEEEMRMQDLIVGSGDPDAAESYVNDIKAQMAEVRTFISQLKASLGALRSHEAHLKNELNEEKQARKNQNELAKG